MEPVFRELGLCTQCVKRFVPSICTTYTFSEPETFCPGCLNLTDYREYATTIKQHFALCGYSPPYKSFSINLNLPICQSIRDRLIFKLIQFESSLLPGSSDDALAVASPKDIIDLKKNARAQLCHETSELLGLDKSISGEFQITLTFSSPTSSLLIDWLAGPNFKAYVPAKYKYRNSFSKLLHESRGVISEFLNCIPDSFFRENRAEIISMLKSVQGIALQHVSISRKSLFVAGRYKKYSRTMSQSPWEEKFATSVSGLIGDCLKFHIGADGTRMIPHFT